MKSSVNKKRHSTAWFIIVSCLVAISATPVLAQTEFGSDIAVATVVYQVADDQALNSAKKLSAPSINLSGFHKITDTPSYSNQPYFMKSDNALAYTQAIATETAEQMDIFIYDFALEKSRNVTGSSTSEYSPTPTPDGQGMSVIRVNAEGKQELWYVQLNDGKAKQNLLPAVEPVGYHAWDGDDKVLLFVLGEPHTLRLATVNQETDQGRVLDTNIGPSLWKIPHTQLFSYSKELSDNIWQLRSVNTTNKQTAALVDMPKGSYYYAWSPKGYAVTAVGSKLYQWEYDSSSKDWLQFADLSEECSAGISRLSFSEKGDRIALVCNRSK